MSRSATTSAIAARAVTQKPEIRLCSQATALTAEALLNFRSCQRGILRQWLRHMI